MFRKDTREIRGGGIILYIREYIQTYETTLNSEADCEEAIWCNIFFKNSTKTTRIVHRSPNIGQEEENINGCNGGELGGMCYYGLF